MGNYQLQEGYKKTEVGVVPEDWIDCSIKHLIEEEIIEKPLDGNHGNIHPKSKDFVPFGIPFIMSNNIHDGLVDTRNCHFIRKQQADQLQKGFSFKGDVLLTHKGTVGNVAVVTDIETDYIMLTPQVTYYRVRNHNRLKNTFIKFYFESTQFQEKLEQLSGGGTRAYIGITNQRKLPFVLPPFPEQCAIAQALSDADTLIAALDKLLAKKRHIKTATMQQLLTGKKRLPGFGEGKGYKKTDIGVIPEDWDVKKVSEIGSVKGGKRLPKGSSLVDIPTPYAYIRVADMFPGGINILNVKWVSEEVARQLKNYCIYSEDIFVSVAGTLGIIGEIPEQLNGANLTENADRITNISCHKKFLLYALMSERIKNDIDSQRTVGAQPKLALGRIEEFKVAIPKSDKEQRAIAQVLTDIDTEIAALEKRRAKTQAIKQGMMQELLTGRTRLV